MNPATLFMHALKETCALHCLLALHIAGPLPVTQQVVMDITSFDDAAVRKGLHKLLVLGLVQCTGDKHRTAWQLSTAERNLPLPLDRLLSIPAKLESPFSQEEESMPITINSLYTDSSSEPAGAPDAGDTNDDGTANDANDAKSGKISESCCGPLAGSESCCDPHAGRSPLPPAPIEHNAPATAAPLNIRRHPFPSVSSVEDAISAPCIPTAGDHGFSPSALHTPPQPDSATLRAHFYAAFEVANVWLQLRRPLADALLAEDGPGWLRQSLGWICYAARRLAHVKRGAVLYIGLRDRLPCDSAYLPPADLPFDAALAWALRGGEDEEPEATAPDDPDPPPPPEPETPEAALWRTVLDHLSLELPSAMLETHLRESRLLSLSASACLIGAPTSQSRDWLANRLSALLARTLKELTGSDLQVDIQTIQQTG